VLRCVKCGNLVEPTIVSGARDLARKHYDIFLKCLTEDETS
jgi:hypothetical protein